MKRRLLSILLALCMMVSLLPGTAWAADSSNIGTYDNFNYRIENNEITITGLTENASAINIPAQINGFPVTSISRAFEGCESLVSVVIPNSVNYITDAAFGNCSNLRDVTLSNQLTEIGAYMFSGCTNLKNITIPDSVVSIGSGAFYDCSSLTSVIIPNNVTSLGDNSFKNCTSLSNLVIGSGISSIKSGFNGCTSLTNITIPNGITSIFKSFCGCTNLTSVTIPSSVTSLDDSFENCTALTNITIPNGVTSINAFSGCTGLTKVIIPSGVTDIGYAAFSNCTDLTSVTIPKSATTIVTGAFSGCPKLKIRCYEDSAAHKYAIRENIPFELISSGSFPSIDIDTKVYCNGSYESFDISLEDCLKKTPSTTYNPQLAHMLIAMCNSVYNSSEMDKTFTDFGFEQASSRKELPFITYSVAVKKMDNRKYLVLAVIRGTGEPLDDPLGWASNFDISINNYNEHSGFSDAAEEVRKTINNLLGKLGANAEQATYVITGFSRGAATTNILARRLSDQQVPQNQIWAYGFACPDTNRGSVENVEKYPCIFNIADAADVVSWIPGMYLGSDWSKFGNSYWFSDGWDDYKKVTRTLDAHSQVKYLDFLRNESPLSEYKNRDTTTPIVDNATKKSLSQGNNVGGRRLPYARVHCPVDIAVYSSSGELAGSTIGDTVSMVAEDKVHISIFGTEKEVIFLDSDEYTLRLTGTDTGRMTYDIQNLDVDTWTTLEEKVFENVALLNEKKFISHINVEDTTETGTNTKIVPLYVLSEDNQPEFKVLPDGEGTEVPINTPVVTFDTTVDSISVAPMAVNDVGTLPSIPAPTRDGYIFSGWYMPDGSKVGTDTVFAADTTVTAHWEKSNTTNPDPSTPSEQPSTPPTNPGGSSYNPGIYTPPTHSITVPSVAGGKVSVNPASASSGSTVTITTTPATGYELASLTVSDTNGKALELTGNGTGKYSFKMPNGKVAISVEFRLVGTDISWSNPFSDVTAGSWYYDAVKFVSEKGLMNGVGNGSFAPNASLSRAMFAQILYNKDGRPSVASSNVFTDVSNGEWYTDAVSWATKNGVINGYGGGLFGPNDSITREQLAVMLWRYAGKPLAANKEIHFSDAGRISEYALDAMCWAIENGILNGKSNGILDPQGFATRAEVAQILMNYLKK